MLRLPRHLSPALLAALLLLLGPPDTARARAGDLIYLTSDIPQTPARLYFVDRGTRETTHILPAETSALRVGSFELGPKGRYVLFTGSVPALAPPVFDLYRLDLRSGAVLQVDTKSLGAGSVQNVRFGPRGRSAVFQTSQDQGLGTLFSVRPNSGAVRTLGGAEHVGTHVTQWTIGPRERSVYYRVEESAAGVDGLYQADLKNGESKRIELPLEAGDSVSSYFVGPRERWMVVTVAESETGPFQLYLTDLRKGVVTKLAGRFDPGYTGLSGFSFKGRDLVYLADLDGSGTLQLQHMDLRSGESSVVNGPLVEGGSVSWFRAGWGRRELLYHADQETVGMTELYHVKLKTMEVTKVNGPLVEGGSVDRFWCALDPRKGLVHYLANQDEPSTPELYRSELKTGVVTRLNAPVVQGGGVREFSVWSRKGHVQYLADQEQAGRPELYLVDGKTAEVSKVNGPLVTSGRVLAGIPEPRGDVVIYWAAQDTSNTLELYRKDLATQEVTKVNPALPPGVGVTRFQMVGRR